MHLRRYVEIVRLCPNCGTQSRSKDSASISLGHEDTDNTRDLSAGFRTQHACNSSCAAHCSSGFCSSTAETTSVSNTDNNVVQHFVYEETCRGCVLAQIGRITSSLIRFLSPHRIVAVSEILESWERLARDITERASSHYAISGEAGGDGDHAATSGNKEGLEPVGAEGAMGDGDLVRVNPDAVLGDAQESASELAALSRRLSDLKKDIQGACGRQHLTVSTQKEVEENIAITEQLIFRLKVHREPNSNESGGTGETDTAVPEAWKDFVAAIDQSIIQLEGELDAKLRLKELWLHYDETYERMLFLVRQADDWMTDLTTMSTSTSTSWSTEEHERLKSVDSNLKIADERRKKLRSLAYEMQELNADADMLENSYHTGSVLIQQCRSRLDELYRGERRTDVTCNSCDNQWSAEHNETKESNVIEILSDNINAGSHTEAYSGVCGRSLPDGLSSTTTTTTTRSTLETASWSSFNSNSTGMDKVTENLVSNLVPLQVIHDEGDSLPARESPSVEASLQEYSSSNESPVPDDPARNSPDGNKNAVEPTTATAQFHYNDTVAGKRVDIISQQTRDSSGHNESNERSNSWRLDGLSSEARVSSTQSNGHLPAASHLETQSSCHELQRDLADTNNSGFATRDHDNQHDLTASGGNSRLLLTSNFQPQPRQQSQRSSTARLYNSELAMDQIDTAVKDVLNRSFPSAEPRQVRTRLADARKKSRSGTLVRHRFRKTTYTGNGVDNWQQSGSNKTVLSESTPGGGFTSTVSRLMWPIPFALLLLLGLLVYIFRPARCCFDQNTWLQAWSPHLDYVKGPPPS